MKNVDLPSVTATDLLTDQQWRWFVDNLIEVSDRHQKSERALLFALILSRTTDAAIKKMLGDPSYWQALDHESGRYITIFNLTPLVAKSSPSLLWTEESEAGRDGLIERLLKLLLIYRRPKLPCLAFFQVHDREIIDGFAIPLESENPDNAFEEIRKLLTAAKNGLSELKQENVSNRQEVFNLAKKSVKNSVSSKKIYALATKSVPIAKLLGAVFGVAK